MMSFPKQLLSYAVIFLAGVNFGRTISYCGNENRTTPTAKKGEPFSTLDDIISQCQPKTAKEIEDIVKEIQHYKTLSKYANKIKEAKGQTTIGGQHISIVDYLKRNVFQAGWSVLDLGAAAGAMLRYTMDTYRELDHLKRTPRGEFQGVELVDGWVDFAKEYFNHHETYGHVGFVQGDITNFTLEGDSGIEKTFDFVMLNDVMEHLQIKRYGCFFDKIQSVTHEGSIVYMHTPTPEAQLRDQGQFYENILPHHIVIAGMALKGFQVLSFEYDMDTVCGGTPNDSTPRLLRNAKCLVDGWPKYSHSLFVRSENSGVFKLK